MSDYLANTHVTEAGAPEDRLTNQRPLTPLTPPIGESGTVAIPTAREPVLESMPRDVEAERLAEYIDRADVAIARAVHDRLDGYRRLRRHAGASVALHNRDTNTRDQLREMLRDLPLEAADTLADFVGDWCDRWA